MSTAYHGQRLGTLLLAEGLLPPGARLVELHIPADGAVLLRYEVYVRREDLPKLARALDALGKEHP